MTLMWITTKTPFDEGSLCSYHEGESGGYVLGQISGLEIGYVCCPWVTAKISAAQNLYNLVWEILGLIYTDVPKGELTCYKPKLHTWF